MAFRSNGPVTLSLPPFRGVTRRIILTTLIAYFGLAVLGWVLPGLAERLMDLAVLVPDLMLHGEVWQLLSYPFVGEGLLSVAFALLSLWYFASSLEEELGGRWLMEYFLVTTIGGGLLASLLAVGLSAAGHAMWLPITAVAGLWPFVLATLVAFAYRGPEQVVNFNFIFNLKAKYLAAIYILLYAALSLRGADRLGGVLGLLSAGCGYVFLRVAPRRGVRAGVSEQWYGLRNAYYRWKRRRAAKKFTVYMRKQGKDVSVDADGKYVAPDERRDPKDKSWMN